ncbi:MAG: N-acetylmuramoyl-L-alanine amidase [Burkholderiales bacterium]|nr:N-acetylmuramoyl-L-alanine amidase [Burkholderiales bacterium]
MRRTLARGTRLIRGAAGAAAALVLVAAAAPAFAAEPLRSVRVWPAQDYTRITIESRVALRYALTTATGPDRIVLDLEGVGAADLARHVAGKLAADDPYVAQLRAGQFRPDTARLVLDLKGEVKPQIFALAPVGDYGHRLVLDLYPVAPLDPLMALLEMQGRGPAAPQEPHPGEAPKSPGEPVRGAPTRPEERTKPLAGRTVTIVLDAGHGGEDPGARGRGGSLEKHITLTVAKRLRALIDAEPGMRAVLTREGDYYLPLATRVEKARRVRADLFVSIHADAFILPHAQGSSVFVLSERGATSVAARWLAKRENDADLIGGVNLNVKDRYLAQTLLDLSQTAQINDSLKLGKAVLGELGGVNRLHKAQVEQAGFAVLKAPDIPSILVETAFISNPEEERRLNDDAYQDRLARAILAGIKRYLAKNPPLNNGRATVAENEDVAPGPTGPKTRRN